MSTTTRRLMENRRLAGSGPMPPEELIPGLPLAPGMKAEEVRQTLDKLIIRSDDVFVVAYPKNGTTWMQQTVKLISSNGVESGVDVDAALPWIEMMTPEEVEVIFTNNQRAIPSPRKLKTQLPFHVMPGGGDPTKTTAKYIYVYRNPKDAAVSMYYHAKTLHSQEFPWDLFFEMYCMQGKVPYAHVVDHVVEWWKHKDSPNIHIECYENMKRNPHTAVSRVATFLGYNLSDDVIKNIAEQTKFANMKENPLCNNSWMNEYHKEGATPFLRKGIIGDWRNHFTDEQSARMDILIAEKLGDTGIVFDYGDN